MDTKGILLWAGFALICGFISLFSYRMKRQIDKDGIETNGVISRIEDAGQPDEIDLHYYVRYRTKDGEEFEGLLSNPGSSLEVGQTVQIKYHPKYKTNVRLICSDSDRRDD